MSVTLGVGFERVRSLRARALLAYAEGAAVVVENLADGDRRTFPGRAKLQIACPLVLSNDGSTIFHSTEQLVAIDLTRGRKRALTHFGPRGRFAVIWDLYVSPDERTLLFMRRRPRPMRVTSLDRRTGVVRTVCRMQGIWRFVPHWASGTLFVATAGPEPGLWRMRLDGRDVERIAATPSPPFDLGVAPAGSFVTYSTATSPRNKSVVKLDVGTGERASFAGSAPALSPDGSRVAFMRSDGELCVHSFAERSTEMIVRVEPNELRPDAGWSRPPSWSRDGSLLWFAIVSTARRETSNAPELVVAMESAAKRAAKRRKGAGRVGYAGSIENTFWDREHANGLVDLRARRVWIREGSIGRATLR